MLRSATLTCLLLSAALAAAQEKSRLPDGAAARLGVHRLRVPGAIRDSALTPDGSRLAVSFHQATEKEPNVAVFDTATGFSRKPLPIVNAQHLKMARTRPLWSPKGTASPGSNGLRDWCSSTSCR